MILIKIILIKKKACTIPVEEQGEAHGGLGGGAGLRRRHMWQLDFVMF